MFKLFKRRNYCQKQKKLTKKSNRDLPSGPDRSRRAAWCHSRNDEVLFGRCF